MAEMKQKEAEIQAALEKEKLEKEELRNMVKQIEYNPEQMEEEFDPNEDYDVDS
jgi:hypothetical protein